MPHVIVKLYPGRSEEAKLRLAHRISRAVVEEAACKERSVSVAFEEVAPENWAEQVYRKEILDGTATLYKSPGYNPFEPEDGQAGTGLMDHVRAAADVAAAEDGSGMFNPMSWLDTQLEDHPQQFDPFFSTPWDSLTDTDRQERMKKVRAVL